MRVLYAAVCTDSILQLSFFFYRATVYNATHGISHEGNVCPSVCPSVRLSNVWIVKKTKETCAQILIPHERSSTSRLSKIIII